MSDRYELDSGEHEDRTIPAICYGLYLFGLTNGLTVIVGLIVAYANMAKAGPVMHSHYVMLVRTVWIALGWLVIGGLLGIVGVAFTATFIGAIIGLPMLFLCWVTFSVGGIWFVVRLIIGVIYLSRNEPHPRPRTWLI